MQIHHPGRYNEQLITPMRQDLTQFGVEETRTPEQLDEALKTGTTLVVTNSVCGCAAGKARPAVGLALAGPVKPDRTITVFAGADLEAVAHLRETKLAGVPPSSPSMALFRDGKPVFVLHRRDIEIRQAPEIASLLKQAFHQYCATEAKV